jgi:hypothetical protein
MSERSHQPITPEHLGRLSVMAADDNRRLTRDDISEVCHIHRDFGPSELGRQRYDMSNARSAGKHRQWESWERTFQGRCIDMFVRSLPVALDAAFGEVIGAARWWLERGILDAQHCRPGDEPSGWHLAHKPAVAIDPAPHPGE